MSESFVTVSGDFDCDFGFYSHEWSCSHTRALTRTSGAALRVLFFRSFVRSIAIPLSFMQPQPQIPSSASHNPREPMGAGMFQQDFLSASDYTNPNCSSEYYDPWCSAYEHEGRYAELQVCPRQGSSTRVSHSQIHGQKRRMLLPKTPHIRRFRL